MPTPSTAALCRPVSVTFRRGGSFALLLAAAVLAAGLAHPARADDDLPGRVGRIADFAGQLYLSPEDRATEWQTVGTNYPVASGDNLWVGGDGRAEVDYGGGQFRLAGDTNLHVSRLDENQIALFIAQGRVILRVRVLDPGDSARIDAPNTQIQLNRPGLYRIDVAPDRQSTSVTVREGEAVVMLANGAQQALPGQMAVVTGPDPTEANVINGTGQDGFDAWSATRDRRYDQPRGNTYVSRQMVGYSDLDEFGTWQSVPEYGQVWYPNGVAADWAPYRDGYWTNVGGWGLTWVDAAPWGYAPFHYGRWAWVRGRWGWCPGTFVARPVWAPALVGWVGGAGWGVSARFGAPVYGWVPLGWGEPLQPWWQRCSYNCWARYNRPYAVNVAVRPTHPPAQFRNVVVPGAVSAVPAATLSGRLQVRQHLVPVPSQQYASAPVLATAPAVPSGPSRIPGPRPGTAGTPAPASTFYPVSRPGRLGVEAAAKQPAAGPAVSAPLPGQSMSRPTGTPAPSQGVEPTAPGRARTVPPVAPGPQIPAATTNVAPVQPATATRARSPQPAGAPEYTPPTAGTPPPPTRQRPPPAVATPVPSPAPPPAQMSRERAPAADRAGMMPTAPVQRGGQVGPPPTAAVPVPRAAQPGASVPHAAQPGAPVAPAASPGATPGGQREGRAERAGQVKAAEKGDAGPGGPAKP